MNNTHTNYDRNTDFFASENIILKIKLCATTVTVLWLVQEIKWCKGEEFSLFSINSPANVALHTRCAGRGRGSCQDSDVRPQVSPAAARLNSPKFKGAFHTPGWPLARKMQDIWENSTPCSTNAAVRWRSSLLPKSLVLSGVPPSQWCLRMPS